MNPFYELLSELKCPNCGTYMQPPIRLCTTGHSFCDRCTKILKTCPTCKQTLNANSRNYVLEQMSAKCPFPCRYKERGCTFFATGVKIRQHEIECRFRNVKCPLAREENCKWLGSSIDALKHCLTMHPHQTYTSPQTHFKFDNFIKRTHRSGQGCVFHVHGQLFKFMCDNDTEEGKTRWCVMRLQASQDDEGTAEDYDFEVKFTNENCKRQSLSLRGPCPTVSLDEEKESIKRSDPSFMLTNFEHLTDFCKTDDLFYNVRIIKRGDEGGK